MTSSDKEIYFGQDVIKTVSEKLGYRDFIVEGVLNTFIESFKRRLEDTDELVYNMPYLGNMILSNTEAKTELMKYMKRAQREKDPVEKERLKQVVKNYRIRYKKIKIELEKYKHKTGWKNKWKRARLIKMYISLTSRGALSRKKYLKGKPLEEVMRLQNEYAYNYYKKRNLPVR